MGINSRDFFDAVRTEAASVAVGIRDQVTRIGTVDPTYTGGSAANPKVLFDGETDPDGVNTQTYPYLLPYHPSGGDRVMLTRCGNTWVITGIVSGEGTSYIPSIGELVGTIRRTGTAQTFATGTTPIVAQWDSDALDRLNSIDIATSNTRYTCTYPGFYRFGGGFSWASNSSGQRYSGWRVNGSLQTGAACLHQPSSSGITSYAVRDGNYRLAVGDYVEMECYQSSGGNLANATGAFCPMMQVYYVGR